MPLNSWSSCLPLQCQDYKYMPTPYLAYVVGGSNSAGMLSKHSIYWAASPVKTISIHSVVFLFNGEAATMLKTIHIVKNIPGSHRDGPAVKSTSCPPRGPGFDSKHPHGSSQLSVNPVPGHLMPSPDFFRHQAYLQCTDIHINMYMED